jgi:hypothetical protein
MHSNNSRHPQTAKIASRLTVWSQTLHDLSIAGTLKCKLLDAPRPLQKRYVQGLVSEIVIDGEKATISGPPLAIAAAVTAPDRLGEVRSFVREWRTRQDSNL